MPNFTAIKHKIGFRLGLRPGPDGAAQITPRLRSWILGGRRDAWKKKEWQDEDEREERKRRDDRG